MNNIDDNDKCIVIINGVEVEVNENEYIAYRKSIHKPVTLLEYDKWG